MYDHIYLNIYIFIALVLWMIYWALEALQPFHWLSLLSAFQEVKRVYHQIS